MVKFLGFRFSLKKPTTRRRLNASARTPQALREKHPMFEYALREYAQTANAGSSNDDGRIPVQVEQQYSAQPLTPSASSVSRQQQQPPVPPPPPPPHVVSFTNSTTSTPQASNNYHTNPPLPPGLTSEDHPSSRQQHASFLHHHSSNASSLSIGLANLSSLHAEPALSRDLEADAMSRVESSLSAGVGRYHKSAFEEGMVSGIYYEESYGDAYTGAPMRYVYPTGYQSMRPRSGPWRLSILICLLFTWLSIFVVGHCSDQVFDAELYNNNVIDDDTLLIDIRWCGSRPLYLMWLVSMLITGLSAAYCGVIGYIKCRDFAVANARSQPFWTSPDQASDYYYFNLTEQGNMRPTYVAPPDSSVSLAGSSLVMPPSHRTASIYQADGTPQFWGSQIYRPTQAAVAVTSR